MHDIAPLELEDIDVTIKLANRDTISPIGIVRDVEVLCGKVKYPADFLVLGSPQDDFCPIIFGRPFLNTASAMIDCEKDKHRPVVGMPVVSVKIGDHCYHGLCDIGASVSAIPFTLYQEIIDNPQV